jgi:hypothetical protein
VSYAGSDHTEDDGESTWRGEESADDLSRDAVVVRCDAQRHKVQDKALVGLLVLLGVMLLLGGSALVGVAAGWFSDQFALQLLALCLAPSFSVWAIVLRWAFQRRPE